MVKGLGFRVLMALLAMCPAGAAVAVEKVQKPMVKNTFRKTSKECVQALKVSKGKATISTGWVFIDGQYIDPPYQVERFGNVIRINGCQVTHPLIPWEEFIKTQVGAKKEGGADENAPEEDSSEAEGTDAEPSQEGSDSANESSDNSVASDDESVEAGLEALFDEEPPTLKKEREEKAAEEKKTVVVKKPVKKPVKKAVWKFDGEFQLNSKARELVKKIDDRRTAIDKNLRSGGYFFFGSRYSAVVGDSGSAGLIFKKLPDAMKAGSTRASFESAMRSYSIAIFPKLVIDDLFANRFVYTRLLQRLRRERESNKWLTE